MTYDGMTAEQYARSKWEKVTIEKKVTVPPRWARNGTYLIETWWLSMQPNDGYNSSNLLHAPTEAAAWQAAADFTVQRLEEIYAAEKCITWLLSDPVDCQEFRDIIGREQAHLYELKKGMVSA